MKSLTVLHVYNFLTPENGGPPQVIRHLVDAQRAVGMRVRLLSTEAFGDPALARLFEGSEIPPRWRCAPGFVGHLRRWPALHRALRGVDLVHLHSLWPTPCLWAGLAARRQRIPYLLSLHGHLREGALAWRPLRKKLGLRVLGYGQVLRGASAFHALNAGEAREAEALAFGPPIHVIPNGAPPAPEGATGALFRERFGLGDDPYLLFLARLHPRKGCARLAEAFVQLADRYPRLQLVFAGNDVDGGIVAPREIIEQAGLNARVRFTGFIDGALKTSALAGALIYALPSDHEGFSVSSLEALAAGCPVLLSEGCHFDEVEAAGVGRVHALTVSDLQAKLVGLLDQGEVALQAMGAEAKLWSRRYQWDQIERRYAELYGQILGAP